MADKTADKKKDRTRTALLIGLGGLGLFLIGRSLGQREAGDDLDFPPFPEDDDSSMLADKAAEASSLSSQLYELSRRLRAGTS